MRRASLAVVVGLAAAACEDETPATPAGTSGGSSSSGSSSTSSSSSGSSGAASCGPADAKVQRAPPPSCCVLTTTDFKAGTLAQALPRADKADAVAWTNPTNAIAIDDTFAEVTLGDGQESGELRIGNFGLNLPAGVVLWGVEVELKRRAPQGGIEDVRVDLEIEGKLVGHKNVKGPWPKSIVGTHVYGQAVDTWRADLLPNDLNATTFAAKLFVKKSAEVPGSVVAQVESIRVGVWYCP